MPKDLQAIIRDLEEIRDYHRAEAERAEDALAALTSAASALPAPGREPAAKTKSAGRRPARNPARKRKSAARKTPPRNRRPRTLRNRSLAGAPAASAGPVRRASKMPFGLRTSSRGSRSA